MPKQTIVKRLILPIESFMAMETSGGIVLIICTIVAMTWANSPWSESYFHLIHLPISLKIGGYELSKSLLHWINDGLMAVFFFMVGMEIKYELVSGELSVPRKAAMPLFGALGGMVAPALIYFSLNPSGPSEPGWGIPMATDIAFAVGVLTLLGRRVPFALKIFLLALAIVDDLGAVLVIAFFYTSEISGRALGMAGLFLILIYLARLVGIRRFLVYFCLGVGAWLGVLKSGIHATIAGVLLGFLTPTRPWYSKEEVAEEVERSSQDLTRSIRQQDSEKPGELHPDSKGHLESLRYLVLNAESPLDRLIHILHPWVSFFIMPVFALVNAGVQIPSTGLPDLTHNSIFLGIALGLFLGKPIGIFAACWVGVRLKLGQLPSQIKWRHIFGAGVLGGIGFTMALFVSSLALSPDLEVYSKLGILAGSILSAILGLIFLRLVTK